jgi:hypothetical protein
MSSNTYLEVFQDFDGKIVHYKGIAHKIKYLEFIAIYPYNHISRSVDLIPVDKTTKYYQDIKKQLGDDWTVDLSSVPDDEYIKILEECQTGIRPRF